MACTNRTHRRYEMRTLTIAAFTAWSTFAMLFFTAKARADVPSCTISLTPNTPSPQSVGQQVVWTTTATNCGDTPVYQYKVAFKSESPKFRITRDFDLSTTLKWGPMQEGSY